MAQDPGQAELADDRRRLEHLPRRPHPLRPPTRPSLTGPDRADRPDRPGRTCTPEAPGSRKRAEPGANNYLQAASVDLSFSPKVAVGAGRRPAAGKLWSTGAPVSPWARTDAAVSVMTSCTPLMRNWMPG